MANLHQLIIRITVSIFIRLTICRRMHICYALHDIISIVNRLAIGILYTCQGACGRIDIAGDHFAASVRLRSHIVLISSICDFAFNERTGRAVLRLLRQHISFIIICVLNVKRRRRFYKQVLFLFFSGRTVFQSILIRRRPSRLTIGKQVVIIVIRCIALHRSQVFSAGNISLVIVSEGFPEFFLMQEQTVELSIIDIALIVHVKTDTGIVARSNYRSCCKLPIRPFFTPLNRIIIYAR